MNPGPVLVVVGRVDHYPVAFLLQPVHPDVIDDGAIGCKQVAVLRVADAQQRDVVSCDGVQEQVNVLAAEFEQSHVAHVEQAGIPADRKVLFHHRRILHRHLITGERHDLGAHAAMHVVQVGTLEGSFRLPPLEPGQRLEVTIDLRFRPRAVTMADPIRLIVGPADCALGEFFRLRRALRPRIRELMRQPADDHRARRLHEVIIEIDRHVAVG